MFSAICPLATEYIWQQLRKAEIVKEESIHLVDWPKSDKKKIDKKLEEEFEVVLKIIESGFAERDKVQIGLKWPLLAWQQLRLKGVSLSMALAKST
jgi:valyl-tRNA synthetase